MLNAVECQVCNGTNPRINRFCNQCGAALAVPEPVDETGSAGDENESPPIRATSSTTQAASPVANPGSSLQLPLGFPISSAIVSINSLLTRSANPFLIFGALAVLLAQLGLYYSVALNEKAPIGYLLLLGLGVASFALGSLGLWNTKRASLQDAHFDADASFHATPGFNILDSVTATLSVIIGVLAVAALLIPLGAGSVSGYMLLPWVAALAAFAAPFLPRFPSLTVFRKASVRAYYGDLTVVLGLMALFIAINLYDLQNWYYSAIGDEFLFFEHAKHITEEGVTRPFSQEGVYNKHPVMSSVFQAAVMKVFGSNYFGWTLSETLNATATLPGIYLLGYAFGGRKAASVSAALFASSHFIFAFSHVGYNNLSSLPVAVWSLALFVLGWRKGNPLLLYAAGIVAGLGFYTHYSGRAMLPIMLMFTLTAGSPRRLLELWPLFFGFVLTVAPTFVVEQEQVFTRMFSQIVGGYSEVVTGSTGDRILNNIEINLPAFNYNSTVHSYVYGPLLDPVSAALAAMGIGFALGHIRIPSLRLLLIWFGVAAFMTGVLSPYPHVAITRLAFAVPPLALLAGILAGQIGDAIQMRVQGIGPSLARITVPALLTVLLAFVLALNLWQFWQVTPSVFPHRPEAVALGAYRTEQCSSDANGTLFIGQAVGEGSLMNQVLTVFDPDGPVPRQLNHEEATMRMELPYQGLRCVIFVNPGAPEARTLQEYLTRRYPGGRTITFTNPSGTTTVEIFAPLEE